MAVAGSIESNLLFLLLLDISIESWNRVDVNKLVGYLMGTPNESGVTHSCPFG